MPKVEFTLREYTDEEYKADLRKLLDEKGLHGAVKEYCDKINNDLEGSPYSLHRGIQEYLCCIMDLIEMGDKECTKVQ